MWADGRDSPDGSLLLCKLELYGVEADLCCQGETLNSLIEPLQGRIGLMFSSSNLWWRGKLAGPAPLRLCGAVRAGWLLTFLFWENDRKGSCAGKTTCCEEDGVVWLAWCGCR